MTLMKDLQYYSPGRRIYYWFGSAFGLTGKQCPTWKHEILVYLGTEEQVKDSLLNGKRSIRPIVNKILDRERALVKRNEQVNQ